MFGKAGEILRQISPAPTAFKGRIQLARMYAIVLLVMSCTAQATEENKNSASSLRVSTDLSEPSGRITPSLTPPSQTASPSKLRIETELRHLPVLLSTLWFDVLRYVLSAAVIMVLLFKLRRYWLTDKQPAAVTRCFGTKQVCHCAIAGPCLGNAFCLFSPILVIGAIYPYRHRLGRISHLGDCHYPWVHECVLAGKFNHGQADGGEKAVHIPILYHLDRRL